MTNLQYQALMFAVWFVAFEVSKGRFQKGFCALMAFGHWVFWLLFTTIFFLDK